MTTEDQDFRSRRAQQARRRRVRKGEDIATQARALTPSTSLTGSLQAMLQLPLLEEIEAMGGRARPRDLYDRLAKRLNLPPDVLAETRTCGDGRRFVWWKQQCRWARQSLVEADLLARNEVGIWELADPGYEKLKKARRGVLVLIWSTDTGAAFWGHAEEFSDQLDDVNLLLVSPPYPITSGRSYGVWNEASWVAWMRDLMRLWKRAIRPDGTIAINVGDAHIPGSHALSTHVERLTLTAQDELGLQLAARAPWHSPNRLGNIQWCARQRLHLRNTVEHVLLFTKGRPAWSVDRVLEPFDDAAQRAAARDNRQGKSTRPSGYDINADAFRLDGKAGRIPSNLIIAGGAPGNDAFSRRLRDLGRDQHPARWPAAVPRRLIQHTTAPGDLVVDPMWGSGVTGRVAADLGRRFIGNDVMYRFVSDSSLRFDSDPGFQRHFQLSGEYP